MSVMLYIVLEPVMRGWMYSGLSVEAFAESRVGESFAVQLSRGCGGRRKCCQLAGVNENMSGWYDSGWGKE